MTMTNDEINAKIAPLQGWTEMPNEFYSWQKPIGSSGVHCRDSAPDYTDSMQYAWELVDEITRQDGYSVEVRDNGRSFNSVCVITEDGGIITVASSDTASRAICLAYIAWKERQAA